MNVDQQHRLLSALERIDALLTEAIDRLGPDARERLFPSCAADAAPIQARQAADAVRDLRATMRTSLDRLGVSVAPATVSAILSARRRLTAAQLAVADIDPARHDDVSVEEARELRALSSDLSACLDRLDAYLAQGANSFLAARPLPVGPVGDTPGRLAEIRRIVEAHDLAGLRGMTDVLQARLADPRLEVAVFGRVNAGKSSLLNRMLDGTPLPAGITPVTEVPIRIVHGAAPLGRVEFVDAIAEVFDLGRLAEFVSAQQNPGNARHVRNLEIRLPADLLAEGIALVDTPGLGLDDAATASETWACIARCDVGLMLIDAAATLTDADIAAIDALLHTGAKVQVLLAKADLLDEADRAHALEFIRRRLVDRLGLDLPVHPVSSRPAGSEWTGRWMDRELRPLLSSAAKVGEESLARKVALLRDAVRAALLRRLAASEGESATVEPRRIEAARRSAEVSARLEQARQASPAELAELPDMADVALEESARNAAVIWNENRAHEFDATTLVEASVRSRAGVAVVAATRQLGDLRAMVRAALADIGGTIPDDLPLPSAAPVIDTSGTVPPFRMHRPLVAFAGNGALARSMRHEMRERGLDQRVARLLRDYERRLDAWRQAALQALGAAFVARRHAIAAGGLCPADSVSRIAADIRRLDSV